MRGVLKNVMLSDPSLSAILKGVCAILKNSFYSIYLRGPATQMTSRPIYISKRYSGLG
jgi:hypothetical protein